MSSSPELRRGPSDRADSLESFHRRRAQLAVLAGQFGAAAGSLLLLLATARILGVEGRGAFSFFLLWPTLGGYLLSLGLPGANLRRAADGSVEPQTLVGNTCVAVGAMSAVLVLPLSLGPPDWLTGPMSSRVTWLAATALIITALFNGLSWLQMGRGRFLLPNICKGVTPCAAALLLILATMLNPTLATVEIAASCWLTSQLVATLWVTGTLIRAYNRPRVNFTILCSSVIFGLKYQAGLIGQLVTYRSDQWVLGADGQTAELGVYSVAVSGSETATYAATALGMTRFRDAARGRRFAPSRTVAVVSGVTALAAVLVALVGVMAIPWVFGEEFSESVLLLLLLLPGTVGVGLVRVCGNELTGAGRPSVVSVISAVQAVVMIAAFVVLIPRYGAQAAAIGSSVGYLAGGGACAVSLFVVSRPGKPASYELAADQEES